MVRKIHWHLTMLLLAAMLVTLIAASRDQVKAAATQAPFSINSTAVPEPSTTSTPPGSPQLPTPPSLLIPPAANPHIPSLRLDFDLSPNPIAVGDLLACSSPLLPIPTFLASALILISAPTQLLWVILLRLQCG